MTPPSQNLGQTSLSPMENESQQDEGSLDVNLYTDHGPSRFGGPYGIFAACCDEEFEDRCREAGTQMSGVKALVAVPGKGYLLDKLKRDLKVYAIKAGTFQPSWFDAELRYIFASLSDVLTADVEEDKGVHYADMELRD